MGFSISIYPDVGVVNSGVYFAKSMSDSLVISGIAGYVATLVAPNAVEVHHPVLSIGKRAEGVSVASVPFTFMLTVTNTDPVADATGVIITDAVPMGANYVSGGSYAGGVVTWSELTAPANGGTAEVTFVVTACRAITNSLYWVVASAEGVNTGWGAPLVVTPAAPTINVAFDRAPTQVEID